MNIKVQNKDLIINSRRNDASIFNFYEGGLYPDSASRDSFNKNLKLLNQRIFSIHKELTYWDLYKITATVSSSTEFDAVVAGLAPGEACIINTTTFSTGDTRLSRGDVIVKTINNENVLVRSVNAGIYYPYCITKSNEGSTYQLNYRYSEVMPEQESSTVNVEEGQIATLAKTIEFTNFQAAHPDTIYGKFQSLSLNSVSFPLLYEDRETEKIIFPVIKFFLNNEEIIGDFSVSVSTENDQVSVTHSFNNLINLSLDVQMQVK